MVARSAAELAHNAALQNKSDFTVEIGALVPRTQHCRRVADSYRHVFPHFRQPSLDRVVHATQEQHKQSDTRLGTCIRCEFARGERGNINYVTIELASGDRYAAFFDLRRFKKVGPNAVHLMVQSAYVLESNKPSPGSGRIHFHALLGHALRGTIPRRPP